MNRRDFAKTTVAGALAALLLPARRDPAPQLREVYWVYYRSPEPLDCDITGCDICEQNYVDDVLADRPIRKFYRDDAERLIVCEHCVQNYLRDRGALL